MGHPTCDRDETDLHPFHVSDSGWDPPYLPRALLHAPVGTEDYYLTNLQRDVKNGTRPKISLRDRNPKKFDAELRLLLGHIEQRLGMGLLEAWYSLDGYGSSSDPGAEADQIKALYAEPGSGPNGALTQEDREKREKKARGLMMDTQDYMFSPEERWAQAFSEMIAFMPYSSVGKAYYDGDQKTMFQKFGAGAHPIVVDCQDLCTLCVLSRGFSYIPDLEKKGFHGCSCTSGSVDYPAFDKRVKLTDGIEDVKGPPKPPPSGDPAGEDAAKTEKPEDAKAEKSGPPKIDYNQILNVVTFSAEVDGRIRPGSILVFNEGGPDEVLQYGDAHIISVLRVSGMRIQFLETGASDTLHKFSDTVVPFSHLVGIGALGAPKIDLHEAAIRLRMSRPLGYGRLVVLDTTVSTAVPRFISKLFHLKYNISDYVWAMRGLPIEGLRVVIHVYIPSGKGSTDPLLNDDSLSSPPSVLIKGGTLLHIAAISGDPPDPTIHSDGFAKVSRLRQDSETAVSVKRPENAGAQIMGCWYSDLDAAVTGGVLNQAPDEMGFWRYIEPTGKMSVQLWCRKPESAELSYVCRPPDKFGTTSKDDVGVAHFDP